MSEHDVGVRILRIDLQRLPIDWLRIAGLRIACLQERRPSEVRQHVGTPRMVLVERCPIERRDDDVGDAAERLIDRLARLLQPAEGNVEPRRRALVGRCPLLGTIQAAPRLCVLTACRLLPRDRNRLARLALFRFRLTRALGTLGRQIDQLASAENQRDHGRRGGDPFEDARGVGHGARCYDASRLTAYGLRLTGGT
jgi:hypothetical protein